MVDKAIIDEIDKLTSHQLITETEQGWIDEFIKNTTLGDIEGVRKGEYSENYGMNMFKILGEVGERFFQSTLVSPNKIHAIKRNFNHINKIYCECVNKINYHFGRHVIHKDSFIDYMCSQLPKYTELFREEV